MGTLLHGTERAELDDRALAHVQLSVVSRQRKKATKCLIPLAVMALVLSGCAQEPTAVPSSSASTSQRPATSIEGVFDSVAELKDAYIKAGGICESWEVGTAQGSWQEYGNCGQAGDPNEAVLSIYSSTSNRDGASAKASKSKTLEVLVGRNWMIQAVDVNKVAAALEGLQLSSDPWVEPEPTPDEKYLARAAELGKYVGSDTKYALTAAHKYCTDMDGYYAGDPNSAWKRIIEQGVGRDQAALEIFCPQYLPAAAIADAGFRDGTFTVADAAAPRVIAAGTYHTAGSVKDCYWERVAGDGTTIENDFVTFAPDGIEVTVNSGEGFVSQRCGTWLRQ